MQTMQKRATLKDVAQAAGVHISTVSRALNPETRDLLTQSVVERIADIAERMGYRTNSLAASLRTRRSMAVGVLIPDITNPVFPPILLGVEDALREHGYIAILANTGNDLHQMKTIVSGLMARQIDGLIFAGLLRNDKAVDECLARGIAAVAVNRRDESHRIPAVVTDDERGVHLAVEHLSQLGHRRIGYIAGPQEFSTGLSRRRGFENAMAALGLAYAPEDIVVVGAYSRPEGQAAAARLLARGGGLTAIAVGNDLLALGCYDALRAAGLECPKDISITGFNDMPFIDLVAPPLTTVRISHHQMGAEAARLLVRNMETNTSAAIDIVLKPELVVRGSSAAPAKGRCVSSEG
jgi:LacI family transcriptional regulator